MIQLQTINRVLCLKKAKCHKSYFHRYHNACTMAFWCLLNLKLCIWFTVNSIVIKAYDWRGIKKAIASSTKSHPLDKDKTAAKSEKKRRQTLKRKYKSNTQMMPLINFFNSILAEKEPQIYILDIIFSGAYELQISFAYMYIFLPNWHTVWSTSSGL